MGLKTCHLSTSRSGDGLIIMRVDRALVMLGVGVGEGRTLGFRAVSNGGPGRSLE
jgi:hypothetical protein